MSHLVLPEFILETHPFPGALAQPSLWSLPRLPSSRFVGRNVTTAASTAVGETRDPDATAPRGAYPWPWSSEKNEGMPGSWQFGGVEMGRWKGIRTSTLFYPFLVRLWSPVPLILFIRCQVEKDSWEVRVSLEGLDGRYGRFWLVSNSLWMIESQPLRTEGNDHIPNVMARDNESLGSPVNCDNCDKVDKDRELRPNHGLTGMTQCPSRIFRKCRHGSSIQILFPSSWGFCHTCWAKYRNPQPHCEHFLVGGPGKLNRGCSELFSGGIQIHIQLGEI